MDNMWGKMVVENSAHGGSHNLGMRSEIAVL